MLWIGRRQAVGVAMEAVRGVGVAPTYWLDCNSFSFADAPTRARSTASFGGIWGGDQAPVTLTQAKGNFDVELGDMSWGVMLYALFGAVANAGSATGYTHTYTLANTNQHASMTITTKDPIGNLTYGLAMINTLELKIVPNKIISYTVDFMSKGSADNNNSVTDTYGVERKFVGKNLKVYLANTTAGLAAAAALQLRGFTLKFAKNAEVHSVLSTVQPVDIVNRMFDITGDFDLDYQDRSMLNYVKNGNYKAMRIVLQHSDVIGVGSTPYSWTLDLSKVDFETFAPNFALDNIVSQKISFNALYDAGGNNNLVNSCVLVNGVATY